MKTLGLKIEVRVGEEEGRGSKSCIAGQSEKGIIIGEILSNWGLIV